MTVRLIVVIGLSVMVGFNLGGVPPVAAADTPYRAGVAVRVITPSEPMWMAGYAARNKPAEGKLHDLYVKALCLQDERGTKLVLVTTDLIGIPRHLAVDVATQVEKKYGIPRAQLMLTASHTHCGPVIRENLIDMYGLNTEEARKVAAYTDKLKVTLVELIGEAVAHLEPVSLRYGHGRAGFAVNRRQFTEKGVVIGVNREGPVDHTVPVLVVARADGSPKAIVFGYACHNTTLSFYQWCGDYAGFAQRGVEKAFPQAVAMFWTGCGGDANPQPRGTVELCERHGRELAEAVVSTVKGKLDPISGPFASQFDHVTLKIETVPTREQLNADLLSKTPAVRRRAERLLKELETSGRIQDTYPYYPIQTWKLGQQVHWVALGGEVVVDYALRLKKELSNVPVLWVTGYANDVMAYIPSARVLREGGYEADSSQIYYGMPGKWSPAIEDIIIQKVKQQAGLTGKLPQAPGPRSPQEELATFQLDEGFRIELVASEPDVIDPVAMCFDARGRLYVCEMRGYPNGGLGTGPETRGRIKCLIDTNRDGKFDKCVTFAERLRFPMGIAPHRNGVLVAVAPDIIYLEDEDGDGRADRKHILYTGFNLANIQQMVNSLQWGVDNWVYACAGSDGGVVRSLQRPDAPPVALRNRGLRFHPDRPASLEPTSGGGQYGLTCDDFQHWFTATNSQHLRQIVLPDHYLRRHPYLPVSAVTLDIPEHGPAARVFRISPFEPWRVERTTRRAGGKDAGRFAASELVPGGYFTSACSPLIYTGDLFPKEFYGNNFVCDPANNLIHREKLLPNGSVFKAVRTDLHREFLASTDNWFRPVFLTVGPEGAIYVLDFYREVIETPLSIPDDIKKQLNMESRDRGRIWRIVPSDYQSRALPDLAAMASEQLVAELAHPNSWRRLTAQRLLLERRAVAVVPHIRKQLHATTGQPGRIHMAYTLQGLGQLQEQDVLPLLNDPTPGVRENGLRLAESFASRSSAVIERCMALKDDPDPMVRFQLAFTAGYLPRQHAITVLLHLLGHPQSDRWTITAAWSSCNGIEWELLQEVCRRQPVQLPHVIQLASLIGARGQTEQISAVIRRAADADLNDTVRMALLRGLGQGMRHAKVNLAAWLAQPPREAQHAVAALQERFRAAARQLLEPYPAPQKSAAAIEMLSYAPPDVILPVLEQLLQPQTSNELQLQLLRAAASHYDPRLTQLLIHKWNQLTPTVRSMALDILLSRTEHIQAVLDAVEKQVLPAADLSPAHIQQLLQHPNQAVRLRSQKILKRTSSSNRGQVVTEYLSALQLKGNAANGKLVFQKHCASCHRLEGVGHAVGPDLLATIGNKSGEDLLWAIFDPNREVDPRYRAYQVITADERVLLGVIVTETPTSITLRRAEGAEDVILRTDITSIRATPQSLMPEGLEKDLKPQDLADLLAFLRQAGRS